MNIKIKHHFVIYAIKIVLCLSLNSDPIKFYSYKFNNSKAFCFNLNFENRYLLESFSTSEQTFSILSCISLSSKNSLAKAISYEVNDDLSISCKSFSPLNLLSTDILISASSKSRIYLRKEIEINYYNCKLSSFS
jgi:hypothetical protein